MVADHRNCCLLEFNIVQCRHFKRSSSRESRICDSLTVIVEGIGLDYRSNLERVAPSVDVSQVSRHYISKVTERSLFGAPVLQF
jgi:hypothetical protein